MAIRAEPFCAASGGSVIDPSLERGLGYLARVSTDGAAALARSLDDDHVPVLWITGAATAPMALDGNALHVTTMAHSLGEVDPKRLSDLRSAASAFLDSHEGGMLVVDCVDLLTVHNGVERVVRTIEDLHDDATTKGGTLIVFVDPRISSPRLVAWLERELEDFPGLVLSRPTPDVMSA